MHAVDDALKIGLGDGGLDAAQAVIAAQGEDENVHGLAENPLHAMKSARGGFAAEAGVDGAPRQVGGVDFPLHLGRVGIGCRIIEPVPGREAVAEEHQGARRVRAERGRGEEEA